VSLVIWTNEPQFDFPPYEGMPTVRYVLAGEPRTGSNMLARALWHTGLAGLPSEYLNDAYVLDFFERWEFAASDPAEMAARYIQQLMAHRTSPNGVFGIKVHGGHLPGLDADLHELLRSPRYLWLRRRDSLRQAISYVLARQTGVWIVDGTYVPLAEPIAEPRYSYSEIRAQLRLFDEATRTWGWYFDHRGIVPHVLFYEDLVARYEETVLGCLRHLDVELPGQIPAPGLSRQANSVTEEWCERFKRDDALRASSG
jgi:trehalose 2-sulfotransferase